MVLDARVAELAVDVDVYLLEKEERLALATELLEPEVLPVRSVVLGGPPLVVNLRGLRPVVVLWPGRLRLFGRYCVLLFFHIFICFDLLCNTSRRGTPRTSS